MDQGMLVWERRWLSRVKCDIEMVRSYLLHEMDKYLYPTLKKLAVAKILRISLSDHSPTRGQIAKKVTTTFNSNFRPLEELAV
jgi:hypothetical protein